MTNRVPRTNKEWEYWGKTDPYYGVLTTRGKQKGTNSPWTADEMREAGRAHFEIVSRMWSSYGIGSVHCIEIGCGSGRITAQLLNHFGKVTALDVSSHQLDEARKLAEANALPRATFEQVNAPVLPVADGACDGVFSCQVFQHFDSDSPAFEYFREAYRALMPGGTLCLNLPIHGMSLNTTKFIGLRTRSYQVLRTLGWRRIMIFRTYNGMQALRVLGETGFEDLQIRTIQIDKLGRFETYFLARKPASRAKDT